MAQKIPKGERFTLADKIEHLGLPMPTNDTKDIFRRGQTALRADLRQARRFNLSNRFIDHAMRVAKATPERLIQLCDLANLPYDSIWIEGDQNYRVDVGFDLGVTGNRRGEDGLDLDLGQFGFLLKRRDPEVASSWTLTVVSPHGISGIELSFDDVNAFEHNWFRNFGALAKHPVPSEAVDLIWGNLVDDNGQALTGSDTRRRILRSKLDLDLDRYTGRDLATYLYDRHGFQKANEIMKEVLVRDSYETRGDIRLVVAALSILNTPLVRYHETESRGRYHHRLKNHTYMDFRTVDIDTTKIKNLNVALDKAWKDDYARRRAHEVRGFWKNVEYKKSVAGCHHIPAIREGDYALCERCGNLLKWVDHHMRGDASIGFVQHDYNLKK